MIEKFAEETIRCKDLIPGYAYLWKDGHVNIFLGFNTENGDFIFYSVGSMTLLEEWNSELGHCYGFYNSELQLKYQEKLCVEVMQTSFDENNLKYYKGMPKIIKSLWIIKSKNELQKWLIKNRVDCNLKLMNNKEKGFVSSKELIEGRIYFTGANPWRSSYVYLGRTSGGEYLWHFIGNIEIYYHNPLKDIKHSIYLTKNNKKVRPLKKELSSFLFCHEHVPDYFFEKIVDITPLNSFLHSYYDKK